MGINERVDLEYKQEVNNTFLKTVSAYANYGDGVIVFGITDRGKVIGINELDQTCLTIENKINDSITPVPGYEIAIDVDKRIIKLIVNEGVHKPYVYKNKAFKRADTATVEIDRVEFSRLILEGQNLSFEELSSNKRELSFKYLEKQLVDHLGIKALSSDILKTLDLYSGDGNFNKAAEILSDDNSLPGIDIVQFGNSINEILDREIYKKVSVLEQFDKAINLFEKKYCYEEIVGVERVSVEKIPLRAFREAIANAVVHRQWDINALIRISMFDDRIEIVSPGGLPFGLTEEEYIDGQVSILRNPILGNLFFRLRYIERFGTGIRRILQSYEMAIIQPDFKVYTNSIKIILPILKEYSEIMDVLTMEERSVYISIRENEALSRKEIEEHTGLNKTKVIRLLNQLLKKNIIIKVGSNRNTRYGYRI
ncbi:ATP-binding protein [Acidaminobacter sp. JC074]|uniref:ATP-binding protein n=1 Tax=Acidaminobacter sp. JC074 TaxID=2530199 RepID=UPI001F0E2730|nr:ATP-binding protein [Acidaminobacter sp. JC074]